MSRNISKTMESEYFTSSVNALTNAETTSAEEEKELGERILKGDTEAANTLAVKNLGLARNICTDMKYLNSLNYEDIFSAATEGLIKAAHKFDCTRCKRFAPIARLEMVNAITEVINRLSRSMSINSDLYALKKKIEAFKNEFEDKNHYEPSYEEMADELGTNSQTVVEALGLGQYKGIEIDYLLDNEEDNANDIFSLLDNTSESKLEIVEDLYRRIESISCSSEENRRAMMVLLMTDLAEDKKYTWKEISKALKVSEKTCRILKLRALTLLKADYKRAA